MPAKQNASEFIGLKYGKIVILEDMGYYDQFRWVKIKCECGTDKISKLASIKKGDVKSCGCSRKIKPFKITSEELIGKIFNRLTIIEDKGRIGKKRFVKAKCICGIIKDYEYNSLKTNNTKSCGCQKHDSVFIHGMSKHPIHKIWSGMIERCYNEKRLDYSRYGGRGVRVSMRWKDDFEAFYNWAIKRWKPGLQLDKDKLASGKNGILYCPELCCFLTPKENTRNKSNNVIIEFEGEKKTLVEWSEKYNIQYGTLRRRVSKGWAIKDAFLTPVKKYN